MTIASDSAARAKTLTSDVTLRGIIAKLNPDEQAVLRTAIATSDTTTATGGREIAWDLAVAAALAAADAEAELTGQAETDVLAAITALDGDYPSWD